MLRLERKTRERLVITHGGETLEIILCQIRRGRAGIGISGPRSFSVARAAAKKGDDVAKSPAPQIGQPQSGSPRTAGQAENEKAESGRRR